MILAGYRDTAFAVITSPDFPMMLLLLLAEPDWQTPQMVQSRLVFADQTIRISAIGNCCQRDFSWQHSIA
ncbi:hypothetical protein TH19_19940 [Thalassospira profundimaris]|uniref:Uncharacterized protein n=1 Tax=Thalassospira profundimaris TaxID=502049 RepID=A0A367VZM0_9PROT|nr:hypothetical protein TH19_19940 [Thalassospira profundimaris]